MGLELQAPKRTFLEKIEGVWLRCKKEEIEDSTAEPPKYPPEYLPYRTLSIATMWEMGIMDRWVDDFARCEELVDEILEKVSLVTDYESENAEKVTPLKQKKVEKLENWEVLVSLMRGPEKEKIEERN